MEPEFAEPDLLEPDAQEPDVLMRGPLHEAFADVHQADPIANPIISEQPPELINEVSPEFRPEGENVQWIPGYWAWDDDQQDFIWISGVWRDVPPNQRWVPGYWSDVDGGFRWISGFWTSVEQEELSYVPEPPASIDQGPSVAAPSDDYFYCPGNWEFQNHDFIWRPGHWQPRVANWIWIPARYVWTPRGCIYRPGYWDYEFAYRGTVFAPVYFQRPIYRVSRFRYCPSYSINTGADFFVHLFVRRNCNHYYFGNWYGRNRGAFGYRPWVSPASHFRHYDPLLAHYNCRRFSHGGQFFISWVNNQHRHYHRHQHHRPRKTVRAHTQFVKSKTGHVKGIGGIQHGSLRGQNEHLRRAKLAQKFGDEVNRHRDNRGRKPARGPVDRQKRYVKANLDDLNRDRKSRQVHGDIVRARKVTERKPSAKNPAARAKLAGGQQQSPAVDQRSKRATAKSGQRVNSEKPGRPTVGNDRLKLPQVKRQPPRKDSKRATQNTAQKIKQAQRVAERKQRQRDQALKNLSNQQRDLQRRQQPAGQRGDRPVRARQQPNVATRQRTVANENSRNQNRADLKRADATQRRAVNNSNRPGVDRSKRAAPQNQRTLNEPRKADARRAASNRAELRREQNRNRQIQAQPRDNDVRKREQVRSERDYQQRLAEARAAAQRSRQQAQQQQSRERFETTQRARTSQKSVNNPRSGAARATQQPQRRRAAIRVEGSPTG